LKEIAYENDTKVQYTYNTLNRIDTITNRASDNSIMTSFDYSYYNIGNIQKITLNGGDAWYYQYDKISQLTREARLNSSDQVRWSRTYPYDDAGNREYLYYYNGSITTTTSYTYNTLNQLTSRSNPNKSWNYDDNGNLMVSGYAGDSYFYWTIDNRLKKAEIYEGTTEMEYAYDISGSRILKRSLKVDNVTDGTRYRYCFNGLTEEVVKESVDGAHSDTAFEFVVKEEGNSASEWYVYDNDPSGATVSSFADYDRLSYVIKCDGQNGNGFVVGDNGSDSYNPNGSPWNETRRVISFWYKGGFSPIYVSVSTSSGNKFLQYYSGNGTNYLDGSGNVCFYLGSGAAASVWNRFERNIEEDWESLSAATWTNTDGLLIRPTSTASYDFYIDDIRFSNSRTKTHNTLSGGSIGQIVSAKNYMSDSYGQPQDVWYSYDHIGNVVNLSNSSGAKTTEYAQDAFGNVLSSATTGAWATSADGRHLTTKEYDDNVDFYYFNARWYDPGIGRFISRDPIFSFANKDLYFKLPYFFTRLYINQYIYCLNNPVNSYDSSGGCNSTDKEILEELKKKWNKNKAENALKDACCVAKDAQNNSAGGALNEFSLVLAQQLFAPPGQEFNWANYFERALRSIGWDDYNVAGKCADIQNALNELDRLINKDKEKK